MFPFDVVSMELILPFMLVLAITYGALEVSKVFANRAVKAIIAVVFAFFAILNYQVVTLINSILPYAAGFFVLVFLVWIVLKPLRGGAGRKGFDPVILIVILVLALVFLARMQVTDYFPGMGFLSNENLMWIVGIAIVVFVVYKAYKIGSGRQPEQ
jgi:glucan phosphoethanolaminetransferase (alkaline phosphatase superfamily)